MTRFNWSSFLVGIIFLILRSTPGGSCYAQASSDPWLIVASGEKGIINVHTTRENLVRSFGAKNLADEDVDVGEGETEPGTVVFANDNERRIEILWKDAVKKTQPKWATISGKKSQWHAVRSISLGMSRNELEHLNGRSFGISGFGTDQPGAVLSWKGGFLDRELNGTGHVIVWLNYTPTGRVTPAELSRSGGDSRSPIMRRLDLHIDRITWEFPSPAD